MSGRPLLLSAILPHLDALLYAWHPGTMGGSAIAELLFGKASPSGRLPASLLRAQGQVPYYYSHKMTGRPVTEKSFSPMQDFPQRAPQTSLGMASFHMDCHFTPLFPFGYGLTYADLEYANLALSSEIMGLDDKLVASIEVINHSDCDALETVQLYIRDFTASQTRPVKELKQFKQLTIEAQTKKTVSFELSSNDLGFYTDQGDYLIEEGEFMIWIGPHAQSNEYKHFSLAL
jgi:beta-glucosidase